MKKGRTEGRRKQRKEGVSHDAALAHISAFLPKEILTSQRQLNSNVCIYVYLHGLKVTCFFLVGGEVIFDNQRRTKSLHGNTSSQSTGRYDFCLILLVD